MIAKSLTYLYAFFIFALGIICFLAICFGLKEFDLAELFLLSIGGICFVALSTNIFCLTYYGR